jgi:hydrogenase maturation factor HypE
MVLIKKEMKLSKTKNGIAKPKKKLLVAVRIDGIHCDLYEFPTVKTARAFAHEMKKRTNVDIIISGFKWGRI